MLFVPQSTAYQWSRESENPYSTFDPTAYLSEYYSDIGSENGFLLKFYHDVFSNLPQGLSLLEFGGGPTIYQLLSASRCATEIVFADFLECNLREVARWLDREPHSFSWARFAHAVALMEQSAKSLGSPEPIAVEERTRTAFRRIIPCDALQSPIIPPVGRSCFDIVSSGFCIECISPREEAFQHALMQLTKWVAPNGRLLLTMLKNSSYYVIGNSTLPAFPVSAPYVTALLDELNFEIMELRETPAEQEQGYDGIIALAAQRRAL